MKWDQSRPVPWQQLIRTWLIYVAVMAAVFMIFFRGGNLVGILGGLFISGPLYLLIGYALAKFGYRRQTYKELRAERNEQVAAKETAASPAPADRPRPAPTKRTGGGTQRKPAKRKR